MSHLCIAEQTVRQVEQTKRGIGPALPPPHHGRIHIYGTLPRPPPPGVWRLFLMWQGHRELEDGRAATPPVRAQTHFQHLPPGRERQKASIEKTDWMNEWKSFVKTSCHRNNTEMVCVVLLDKPCLDKGCSKEKCCSALRLRDALIMLNRSALPCFGGDKGERFSFALHYSGVLTWFLDI